NCRSLTWPRERREACFRTPLCRETIMATKKTGKTKAPRSAADKAAPAKAGKARGATPGKKLSALEAAATVLGESGKAMNCKELIEAMAAAGYWSPPKGKTPHATLYSALAREIATKGTQARFRKAERGKFTLA